VGKTNTTRRKVFTGCMAAAVSGMGGTARAAAPIFSPDAADAAGAGKERGTFWRTVHMQAEDGGTMSIVDLARPLVLVNLWAHWCPGCLMEFESMQRMSARLGDMADIVLVSHPSNWEADKVFARRHPLGFPLYTLPHDSSQSELDAAYGSSSPGSYSVPQSLVFGGFQRTLSWLADGPEKWDSPGIMDRMAALAKTAH
jgi:thiol-disulfide isomerase/thioredoxin